MILSEQLVRMDPAVLASAWTAGAPTFAILPDRSDLSEDWVASALAALPEPLSRDHFLVASSGSTGTPKMVVASRARAEAMAETIARHQQADAVESMVIALPLSYCFALVNQFVLAHLRGLPMRFAGFGDPAGLAATLDGSENAMICLVGAQATMLPQLGAGAVFPNVRRIAFAGSPFPWGQAALLKRMFPKARFSNNYGCAEAMPRLVVEDVTDRVRSGDAPADGQIGHPLPGVALRADPNGALEFQSRYAALGYVTPGGFEPFPEGGWISTGDSAHFDEGAGWILRGRIGDVFKRHGEKVSVARLRATIEDSWGQSFALIRGKDRAGEDGLQLVLEGAADRHAARRILKAIRDQHPRAFWPLQILRFDTLPRLGNGKIDNTALRSETGHEILWDQRV